MGTARFIAVLTALSAAAWAQFPGGPLLYSSGPVNAATCSSGVQPGAGIAQGAMFVLRGLGLTGFTPSSATSYPLPTELGGTSVEIRLRDSTFRAPLLSASFTEVIGVLPSAVPVGEGVITATFRGSTSSPVSIWVVPSYFGVFTLNSPWVPHSRASYGGNVTESTASTGPGFIETVSDAGVRRMNTLVEVARPGQAVVISGTGLGALAADDGTRPFPGDLETDVEVVIGGKLATVISKRRAECCPGVDELVVQVPEGVEGCYVPVAIRAAGWTSNFVTMSIASQGDACPDFPGLPASDPARVRAGGALRMGEILLARIALRLEASGVTADAALDIGRADFAGFQPNELFRSLSARSFLLAGAPSAGHCLILPNESSDLLLPFVTEAMPQTELSTAGASLSVSGPLGSRELMKENGYLALLGGWFPGLIDEPQPQYLDPGSYSVTNGDGGADVGPLAHVLSIPPHLVWTNRDDLSEIARTEDLTVRWESADQENELVTVMALSGTSSVSGAASLLCTERASAGQFTVPAWILSRLPKSETEDGLPFGFLGLVSSPLPHSGAIASPGLDSLRFRYAIVQVKNVDFQ